MVAGGSIAVEAVQFNTLAVDGMLAVWQGSHTRRRRESWRRRKRRISNFGDDEADDEERKDKDEMDPSKVTTACVFEKT